MLFGIAGRFQGFLSAFRDTVCCFVSVGGVQ